jgi:hypothetical protein
MLAGKKTSINMLLLMLLMVCEVMFDVRLIGWNRCVETLRSMYYLLTGKLVVVVVVVVCVSQMNGAELPGGSVLHVEPASSNSSSCGDDSQQSHYGPPVNAVGGGSDVTTKSQASYQQPSGEVKVEDETPAQADNDEDLDDFFDSL